MHDLEFGHAHMAPGEELNEVAWAADNVELTTVGIDIGSSTSHLMFAQVHLQRLGTALSSRFVVVNRKVHLAIADHADALPARLHHRHRRSSRASSAAATSYADLEPDDIDSGAVILTGEAIKRHNARAIADLFSEEAGRSSAPPPATTWNARWRRTAPAPSRLSRGHGATLAQHRHRRRHHQVRADREGPDRSPPRPSRSAAA